MDWVEAIGFQKEAVHTGALCHLLGGAHGRDVARALTGDRRISGVGNVRPEAALRGGSRRAIDLAANIHMEGEEDGCLAIEVKVDAAWRHEQLTNSVPSHCHGVLVAAGYTALAVDDRDLAAIEGYRWPWRRVGPDALGGIVRDHAAGDRELRAYANRLDQEARDQADAVQAVAAERGVTWGRAPRSLGHWAYFSEVVRNRGDIAEWERKSLISGALMTLWVNKGGHSGDYLEFMGEGERRSLCVKTWAAPGSTRLRERRERLIELFAETAGQGPTRQPSAKAKTCTAVRFPLDGKLPGEAAALVDELVARLESKSTQAAEKWGRRVRSADLRCATR
jgi:hypothetical protein